MERPHQIDKGKLSHIKKATRVFVGAMSIFAATHVLPSTSYADGGNLANQNIDQLNPAEIIKTAVIDAKSVPISGGLGQRITKDFLGKDGFTKVYFQRGGYQFDQSGNKYHINILDEMHNLGLDSRLADGSLGVLVPPQVDYQDKSLETHDKFKERVEFFNITPPITEKAESFKKEGYDPGLPTSPVTKFIDNSGNGHEIARFQRVAFAIDIRTGEVTVVLAGDAAKKAGVIPVDAQLDQPTDDPEIIPVKPKVEDRYEPTNRGASREDVTSIINWGAQEMGISPSYATSITFCESRHDPAAHNQSSGARGLWQIMPLHAYRFTKRGWDYWRDWMDARKNTAIAIEIKRDQGIRAWDCA
jgi:hypothetical protein